MTEAYIYDAIRTPRGRGKRDGSLHTVKPLDLVVGLIDEVRGRFPEMDVNRIDDVLLGVVTPVGDQGACIAKTAALAAGLRVVVVPDLKHPPASIVERAFHVLDSLHDAVAHLPRWFPQPAERQQPA